MENKEQTIQYIYTFGNNYHPSQKFVELPYTMHVMQSEEHLKEYALTHVSALERPFLQKISCCVYSNHKSHLPDTPDWYNEWDGKWYFNNQNAI